jgi:hypothetical protein
MGLVVPERPGRPPEDASDPKSERLASARGRRCAPSGIGEPLDRLKQLGVRALGLSPDPRHRPGRLALDVLPVDPAGADGELEVVDRCSLSAFPRRERVERVLLPARQMADEILRRPFAAAEARPRETAAWDPLEQVERAFAALSQHPERRPA